MPEIHFCILPFLCNLTAGLAIDIPSDGTPPSAKNFSFDWFGHERSSEDE
jgi:hypothetical protein